MNENVLKKGEVELTNFVRQWETLCAALDPISAEKPLLNEFLKRIANSVNAADMAKAILGKAIEAARDAQEAQAIVEDNVFTIMAPISMALDRLLDEECAQTAVNRLTKPIYEKINQEISIRFPDNATPKVAH